MLSLNIQLYHGIAVFPRLHPNTTYLPNTDDTDYTDNRVVFIIWTDNVNAICTTTISSDIQLWYCIAVFPRLYPSNTYLPNTDYTDYTDNRVVFIIWRDNVNAICKTTISSSIQLWYCIAVFPRLYSPNTYLPNTDYTDYTAYRVVLTIWTDTVQLPVNGPCKSRYLAINVICTTVLSLNIQLYNCIAVFPRLHPNTTYLPNTDDTDYTDNRVVFIIWTDNVNAICTTTISSDIQLWYCFAVFPRLYPSKTNLPNTDYTDYTDKRVVFIIWTDNVNAICTTTISSDIQLWYCIAVFPRLYPPKPTCQTLITLITLVTESFLTIWTDTVQLPVNGPCKSRYLAINVICTTVLSLNIQLYHCIAVFPRLHPNTTYMPNTDDTDYTDNRVVFIVWTDNVNAICTTTISADIQLWYCIAVFPRLYPSNTNMPNTDYTDYTDNRVVFIIWTDNVNAICTTTISSYIQLWYCIAVFPGLYPSNTYLPNTDYTDYTDNIVVFIIWTDNVNAICTTTISSNIQLWYCIAVFPRLYPPNTYLPNTDYTDYTGCRVVFNHLHR